MDSMKNVAAAAALIAVVLSPSLAAASSHPDDPKPEEQVSRPGQMQAGRKRTKPPTTATMKAGQRPMAKPVNGRILLMEEELKSPDGAEGKHQEKVDAALAEKPEQGTGEQKRGAPVTKPAGSHMELMLKVFSDGKAEIVSAKEVAGPVVVTQSVPGQWVYAVFSEDKTLAVHAIADPFERRSFAPPPGSPLEGKGHHVEHVQTALIPVAVPDLTFRSASTAKLSLKLYRVKEGPPLLRLDSSILKKLQDDKRLETKVLMSTDAVTQGIMLRAPGAIQQQ